MTLRLRRWSEVILLEENMDLSGENRKRKAMPLVLISMAVCVVAGIWLDSTGIILFTCIGIAIGFLISAVIQ